MARTTLVTLKARSQAFRMAMGVLHWGKTVFPEPRCQRCRQQFHGQENRPSAFCPDCQNLIRAEFESNTGIKLAPCERCGAECAPIWTNGQLMCPDCRQQWKAELEEKYRPTSWERACLVAAIVLLAICVGGAIPMIIWATTTHPIQPPSSVSVSAKR